MNRADYNVGNLESEIKVQFDQAVSALNQTYTALEGVTSGLKDVISQIDNLKGNTGLKEVTKQAEDLKKVTNGSWTSKALNIGDVVKSTVKLGVIFSVLRKGFNIVKDITSASIDMIETTNLFEVMMGKVVDEYGNLDKAQSQYYLNAIKFQDEMTSKLLVNRRELMETQSMFYSLYKNQGVDKDKSYFISEQLSKAVYDLSSLYNVDTKTMSKALVSGITGQVESLRNVAKVDISEMSLQPILDQLGIERSVRQLNYAEKELVRYMAILKQAGQAQGDFARTIDTPANQLKVFQAQLQELKQVAGSFFTGLFGQILPVVNGIIMAIKEILKALGAVFGFEVNTGNNALSDVSDTVGDIGSGLGSATKKAKEFKKQLMGFDEINNIEPPSESGSSGGGGGSVAGIDSRLLDALKEWDNQMDSISGKAQEIRDKMLEWLGFERNDDGTWKLKEGLTNFEKILDVVKAIGLAIGTWKVAKTITNLLKNLGILNRTQAFKIAFGLTLAVSGLYLLYKGVKHILDGNVDLFTILETIAGGAMGGLGIASLLKGIAPKLPMGKTLKIGFGITIALTGIFMEFNSVKKMLSGDISIATLLQSTGSSFLIGIGTWLATGSIPAGLIATAGILSINIGVELGLSIFSFSKGLKLVKEDVSELKSKVDDLNSSLEEEKTAYENTVKSIKDSWENKEVEVEYSQKLAKQLDDLVDANGRVKAGNEERVEFILNELNEALGTEYGLNNNLITKNGEVVGSYKDLQKSINDTIEVKKKEAKQEAITELYKESIKEQIKAEKSLQEAHQTASEAYQKYQKMMSDGTWSKDIAQAWIDAENTWENAKNHLSNVTEDVTYYNQQMTDNIVENTGKLSTEMVTQGQVSGEKLQEMVKTQTETWEETYNKLNSTQQSAMLAQSTTLDEWSPTIQQKWADMANNSASDFLTGISTVDKDVQAKILSAITTTDNLTPEMVNAWSNLANTSFLEYAKAMSQLEPNVQDTIIAMRTKTEGLTPEMVSAWKALASESKDRFNEAIESLPEDTRLVVQTMTNGVTSLSPAQIQQWANMAKNSKDQYERNLSGLDSTTSQRVQSCVDAINNKQWTAEQTAQELANAVERGVNTIDTTEAGKQAVNGVTKGINDNKNSWSLRNAISGVVSNVKNWFKSKLGIASPSKVFAELSSYIPAGIAKGINDNIDETTKPIKKLTSNITDTFRHNVDIPNITKELNQGIKINPKDFEVDTNQYINYGAIKGQIIAQSQVNMNENIADRISEASYNAFMRAMNKSKITVEVEGKADKDGIFKVVQKGAKEYTMQTGEPAFD